MSESRTVPFDPQWGIGLHGSPLSGNLQIPHSLGDHVVEALDKLGDRDQELLRCYYWERMTYEEVSARFALMGKQYAFYEVQRAAQRLGKILTEQGIDYEDE